jgi:hypothetical protein
MIQQGAAASGCEHVHTDGIVVGERDAAFVA